MRCGGPPAYSAAIDRFRGIMIRFPEYPQVEKVLFHLAQAHKRNGDHAEARLYLDRIVTMHPNGDYAGQAQKALGSLATEFEGKLAVQDLSD